MVRLIEMKVEPFLVASTVNVIIAQRLVRKICDKCRAVKTITTQELKNFFNETYVKRNISPEKERVEIFYGSGCKECGGTGYAGRIGLYETILVSPRIRELTVQKVSADKINEAAVEEGTTLMGEDGFIKVLQGLTSVEEVMRVTKTDA